MGVFKYLNYIHYQFYTTMFFIEVSSAHQTYIYLKTYGYLGLYYLK